MGASQVCHQRDDDRTDKPAHAVLCLDIGKEALQLPHAGVELDEGLGLVYEPSLLAKVGLLREFVPLGADLVLVALGDGGIQLTVVGRFKLS